MAGTSSLWPLHVAIAAKINGDAALKGMLSEGGDGVFSLVAPRGAPFDYIVLGDSAGRELPTFARKGENGSITLHLWCAGDDQMTLLQMYGELRRVLHDVRLTLTGTTQVHCLGKLDLITTAADPSGEMVHGVARYAFLTL
jgi:hypothetical protein